MDVMNFDRHGWAYLATLLIVLSVGVRANTNTVYSPCMDTTVLKNDGFTFGLAIASNKSFFLNRIQLSPCDLRLQDNLRDGKVALFRPKVDEITLLLVNHTEFNPVSIIFLNFLTYSWFSGTMDENKCLQGPASHFCIHSKRKVCCSFWRFISLPYIKHRHWLVLLFARTIRTRCRCKAHHILIT